MAGVEDSRARSATGRGRVAEHGTAGSARTRWRSRLAAAARVLVVLLAASGGLELEAVAAQVGLDASRAELVQAYAEHSDVRPGARLAAVAALTHRLERGIRLM